MKTIFTFITIFILATSFIGISSYSEVNNTQEKGDNPRDTFNTAFYQIGNYFEYFHLEQIIQYRSYRYVEKDTLINGFNYKVIKTYSPRYGTSRGYIHFDEELRYLKRSPTCPMADSNGNIIEIGFNFPVGYSWKRCINSFWYTQIIYKGDTTGVLGDTTTLDYIISKDTLELIPDERKYIEKFGFLEFWNFIGPNWSILVGAIIDSTVYGSVILNIKDPNIEIPSSFKLHQNYPNPFNSSTVIKFSTPVNQRLNIVIFDNLGREVQRLDGLFYYAGNHEITINADNLTSGVYFYRVEAGEFIDTRKMVLIK